MPKRYSPFLAVATLCWVCLSATLPDAAQANPGFIPSSGTNAFHIDAEAGTTAAGDYTSVVVRIWAPYETWLPSTGRATRVYLFSADGATMTDVSPQFTVTDESSAVETAKTVIKLRVIKNDSAPTPPIAGNYLLTVEVPRSTLDTKHGSFYQAFRFHYAP